MFPTDRNTTLGFHGQCSKMHLHPRDTALIVDDDYVYNPVDAQGYTELMMVG